MKTITKCKSCEYIAFGDVNSCPKCGSRKLRIVEEDELTLQDGIRCVENLEDGAQYDERKCLSYLSDIAPSLRRERIMLSTAFRCGAVRSMRSGTTEAVAEAIRLMEDAGMNENAVGVVLRAYGLQAPSKHRQKTAADTSNPTEKEDQHGRERSKSNQTDSERRVLDYRWLIALVAIVLLALVLLRPGKNVIGTDSNVQNGSGTNESVVESVKESETTNDEIIEKDVPQLQSEPGMKSEYVSEPESETKSEPVLTQEKKPEFNDAMASSTLKPDQITSYYGPLNAIDGNPRTAWNEGADGNGIGEWLKLSASSPQIVRGINIMAGYPKTEDIYYWNNRPCDITITLSDGYSTHATLTDVMSSYQPVAFDGLHETSSITIVIDSVYSGTRWDDTSFAEVEAY